MAAWLHIKVTWIAILDKQGNIVKLVPPEVTTAQQLFIVRDDGVMFGDGWHKPFTELDLTIQLPEIPPQAKFWQAPSVKGYVAGARPTRLNYFTRWLRWSIATLILTTVWPTSRPCVHWWGAISWRPGFSMRSLSSAISAPPAHGPLGSCSDRDGREPRPNGAAGAGPGTGSTG